MGLGKGAHWGNTFEDRLDGCEGRIDAQVKTVTRRKQKEKTYVKSKEELTPSPSLDGPPCSGEGLGERRLVCSPRFKPDPCTMRNGTANFTSLNDHYHNEVINAWEKGNFIKIPVLNMNKVLSAH